MAIVTPSEFLSQVAQEAQVKVLFAVEAGSRAWGFPSPDSDFDIRFVYARSLVNYLTIQPMQDVIQRTEGDLDLVGWDIRKALLLMLKGNHAIREWLRSPIQYISTDFHTMFLDLARHTPSHTRLAYSYRSLLHKVLRDYLPIGQEQVLLKKYFYAIRSALVIEWLYTHKEPVPPMCLADLLDEQPLDRGVRDEVAFLWDKKLITSELGYGPRLPAIDKFIFKYDTTDTLSRTDPISNELIRQYDDVLQRAVITRIILV